MSTIAAIRAGIADNLNGIAGIQAKPYMLANPTPPAAHVIPGAIGGGDFVDYDTTFARGGDLLYFTVEVFVGLTSDMAAQKRLDTFLDPDGPFSVKAAIEDDPTLGSVIDDLRVTKASGYRTYLVEGRGPVLGCQWEVEAYT